MAILLREAIGDTLRRARSTQGRTLREVSDTARVSLGYLSEVERGRKEASSELLAAICGALDVPLSEVLSEVSGRLAYREAPVAGDPARRSESSAAVGSVGSIDVATKMVIPQVRAMAAA
jgi:transcriptional regulator with XRE-family HTH domain